LASTLAQAQAYTQKAQEFLKSRNFAKAQEQLRKAKVKLDSANSFSKNIYENSSEFLGKARVRTEKVFKEAWKDISDEPKKSDGAAKKPPSGKK
jgi:cellobiose-specific phosphotransferase system component IIA